MPVTHALAGRARHVVESAWFSGAVLIAILANAALLGIETYSGLATRWHGPLKATEHGFLVFFSIEIALRATAHADRPRDFFRDPWNLFDLAIVALAVLPIAREDSTALRLLRLARVLRTARFLPQVRIILAALGRSLPGTFSFLVLCTLVLYVYSMVGWTFLADDDPEHYGSLGRAALTLFLLITLDGLGDAVHTGLEISGWTILYYGSFVVIGSFILMNLLIGVVINSLEEAREIEDAQTPRRRPADSDSDGQDTDLARLRARLTTAREALDALEAELATLPRPVEGEPPRPRQPTPT